MENNSFKYNIMLNAMFREIARYEKFVLYGAGSMARKLLKIFKKKGLCPLYCVVTKKDKDLDRLEDVQVYNLHEKIKELQERKMLVIVSVSELYEQEIVELLHSREVNQVIMLSQYECLPISFNTDSFQKTYKDKDFTWYLSRIKAWYFEENNVESDALPLLQNTADNRSRILFVIENFSPRVIKIVRALKKIGKEPVILINQQKTTGAMWEKFHVALGIDGGCNIYKSIEELLFYCLKNAGSVIHVFSNPWDPYAAYILVSLRKQLGRVVFDQYDIANGFYTIFSEEQLEIEKYCLENADGVCYREFSLEYLTDALHFHIKGKTLRFFDYCSSTCDMSKKNENYELSLCYAGGVLTEKQMTEYKDCVFCGFMELADRCEENKCHLHIYPSSYDKEGYKMYIEKDKKSEYFHFHETVSYNELISEITQYDYGITPTGDDVWEKEESGYNTKEKYIYSATNKYFDYLDAGLPIIAAIPLKFAEFLEEKGVLIKWTNGQYDFAYLRSMKNEYKNRIAKVREELHMDNYIKELTAFYESL